MTQEMLLQTMWNPGTTSHRLHEGNLPSAALCRQVLHAERPRGMISKSVSVGLWGNRGNLLLPPSVRCAQKGLCLPRASACLLAAQFTNKRSELFTSHISCPFRRLVETTSKHPESSIVLKIKTMTNRLKSNQIINMTNGSTST